MLRRRRCEDEETILREPGDGPVVLDPATRVQEERVGEPADRDVHVVGAHPLEEAHCVRAGDLDLRERAQIEERHRFPGGAMFLGRVWEPVLPAERVVVGGLDAGRCEPHRALPLRELAEARPGGLQPIEQRRHADVPRRGRLEVGPVHRVQAPERFRGPLVEVALVRL